MMMRNKKSPSRVECGFIQHVGEGGEEWRGGPLWSPNTHQPKKSPSTSVGARVVEWGREGLDGRPRPVPCAHLWGNALTPPAPGDHKGPPHIRPTTLAPTDHPACCLASRLRLIPIGGPLWSPAVPLKHGDPLFATYHRPKNMAQMHHSCTITKKYGANAPQLRAIFLKLESSTANL